MNTNTNHLVTVTYYLDTDQHGTERTCRVSLTEGYSDELDIPRILAIRHGLTQRGAHRVTVTDVEPYEPPTCEWCGEHQDRETGPVDSYPEGWMHSGCHTTYVEEQSRKTHGYVVARDRDETDPCERLTPGCSVNHTASPDHSCETW